MNERPLTVTGVAWLFIATGVFGFALHSKEIATQKVIHAEDPYLLIVSLVGLVAGIFLLFGHNWARWLASAWMMFHVVISFFDSLQKAMVHIVLFGLIAYCLFRADARAYFQPPDKAGT